MKRLRHKTESEVKNPRLLRQDRGLGQYMLGTLLRRVSPSILRLRCNRKDVNQTVESSCNKKGEGGEVSSHFTSRRSVVDPERQRCKRATISIRMRN